MKDAAITGQGDFVAGAGAASRFLAHGMHINSLRTNDVLQTREWLEFDTAVVKASVMRLNGVADLMAMGLTKGLPNALGTTIVQWDDVTKQQAAEQSMDGISTQRRDKSLFAANSVPIYITHKDFQLNLRTLEASRRYGMPLDTAQAEDAGRRVAEKLESALFNGSGVTVTGSTAYGYLNFPQRHIVGKTADWANGATTGAQILTDVLAMITACQGSFYFGPYMLYVSTNWWIPLMNDFKTYSDDTILDRIRKVPGIIDVKPADQMPASSAVLVQMTNDVVDLIDGQQPTTVMWDTEGGFQVNFKVMSIVVPRLKFHQDTNCGIAHCS